MYRDSGYEPRTSAPVNVGDELDVTIEAVGAKGDGIAKKEGFVLFVPGVQKDDKVKIRITKVLRKVGFAEVVGKSEGSSDEQPADSGEDSQQGEGAEPAEEEAPKDSEDFGEEEEQ